jgi:ABC-type transport system involved in cytochrome bd biosynthesis fused ATPase/permease subunit
VLEAVSLVAMGRSRPVLDAIDLRVAPGERVCLIGESGAGKSSLLRVAAGLVVPSAGRCRLEGMEGPCLPAGHRSALGWVPQHPTVLPATVLDNITLGRPGTGERAALAALEAAGLGTWLRSLPQGLHTPLSEFSAPLSLGERRRLAVARGLAGPRPRLWLLDEPTAGLDRVSARGLMTELNRITEGVTAVIATHDPAAMILGQRTIELHHGRIRRPPGKPHRQGKPPGPGGPSATRVSAG